jgi:hypothetical protein
MLRQWIHAPGSGLSATYLLHLVERGLIHAKLFKVILRCRNDFLDDVLIDGALESLSARGPSLHPQVLWGY